MVRLKAAASLKDVGTVEAIKALEEAEATDTSSRIRKEVRELVGQSARGQLASNLADLSEPHRRGISITLSLLDEALCEMAAWAGGREVRSVFYQEHNTLTKRQRQAVLKEVSEMRGLLRALRDTPGLETSVHDAATAIRSSCLGLWEHLVGLEAAHLSRYGEVPPRLAETLDPLAASLVRGITRILDALGEPD